MTNQGRLQFLCALVLALGSAHARGAEWKIDPNILLRSGYNDNITLRTNDELSAWETVFTPSATFSRTTATAGISGNIRFDFRRYLGEEGLDDNNKRLFVDAFRRMERARMGLNLALVKDTTLDSQLDETGIVFARVRRFTQRLNPNWRYNIGPRTRIQLDYTYSNVDYANTDTSAFTDYSSHNGQALFTQALNERAIASLTLGRTLTSNERDVDTTYSYGQAGLSYRFSETLSASLSAGLRRTDTEFSTNTLVPTFPGGPVIVVPQDVQNSSTGAIFNGSLTRQFERGDTSLTATRNVTNTISGFLIEVTRLRWSSSYRFSDTLSAGLSVELYSSKGDDELARSFDRKYVDIRPRFGWNFRKFWSISGSYRYRKQSFDDTSDEAIQNAAYLTLTYRWPRIAVSR